MNIEEETPTKTAILNAMIFSMMYLDHQAETPAIDISSNEYTSSGVRDSPDTTTSSIWWYFLPMMMKSTEPDH
tara:strand:+ start:265 stop:483 length:219 start_codon:yes stop_codon:yes gene_type:complete